MDRLTSNKAVSEMGMFELAHNACYIKDGKARYRDYDIDIDARELTRKLLKDHADDDNAFTDDDNFDDWMIDYLQEGLDSKEGLIALFYRNLWAMADLREKLKRYEDLKEQEKITAFPCTVGDTVYIRALCECVDMDIDPETGDTKCPFKSDCSLECENGMYERIFPAVINKIFNDGTGWHYTAEHLCTVFDLSDFGRAIFLTKEQAEQQAQLEAELTGKEEKED